MKRSKRFLHWFYLSVVILIIWLAFGAIYYACRSDFSVTDPNKPQNLNIFLERFFPETCTAEDKTGGSFYIDLDKNGCTYHHTFPAKVIVPAPDAWGSSEISLFHLDYRGYTYKFNFDSYSNGILKLKYVLGPLAASFREAEYGILSLDLSHFENPLEPILVRFTPHIPFGPFFVEPINEQAPFDAEDLHTSPRNISSWGKTLGYKLMGIESGHQSMTVGHQQPYFNATSGHLAYSRLRNYFERGSMEYFHPEDFVYFSAAILTSSALGDIAPTSHFMKILVSLQSLLGIIWLGLAISLGYEHLSRSLTKN